MNSLITERPMIFFDLETTGTNILTDRIVEISVIKISPNGEREEKTRRLNPEMHIPEEASAIHGIYDDDVKNEPTFRNISKNLLIYFEDCDLGGYNITKFDVPVLIREFSRAGLQFSIEGRRIVDAYHLYCRMEPRNLSAAYKKFCGKDLNDAHSASADVLATLEVFNAEVEKYSAYTAEQMPPDTPFKPDLNVIHEICNPKLKDAIDPEGKFRWHGSEAVVGFGKNNGIPLKKIALDTPDFLRWIIRSEFTPEVKQIASDALKGVFPEKK